MAIFLGKFSSNFPDQINQGYYQTDRINMFDSLEINDYVFAIGNGIIQLWKATEWIDVSNGKRMNFEKIIPNLNISTNQLIALKCFQLSKNLVIYSMRQGTRAFYKIGLTGDSNIDELLTSDFYSNPNNFRKISVYSSRENVESSNEGNLVLFKENGVWKINPNSYSETNLFSQFRDNSSLVNRGQRQKDSTINKINGATLPRSFLPSELSIRSLYDAFCCEYKVNGQTLNIGVSRIYKISMSPNEINEAAFRYLIENNLVIVHEETPSKARSVTPQGENFTEGMNVGDYFYMTRGNNGIIVLGKILGEAVQCEYGDLGTNGWFQREYEILYESIRDRAYTGQKKWWTPNDNSTFIEIPPNEITLANRLIFEPFFAVNLTIGHLENNNADKMNIPLNQILYGPPGTGKTHNTRNMSLEILGIECVGKDREEIVEIYKDYVESGQIVFTTFHQSMSYEDFIEGIKPLKPIKDTPLQYDIEEGIFKIACERAIDEIIDYLSLKSKNSPQPINLSFKDKYKLFVQALKEGKITPETKTGLKVGLTHVSSSGNMHLSTSNSTLGYIISLKRLKKLVDHFPNPTSIQNVHDEIRGVIGGSHASLYYAALSSFVPFVASIEKESQEEGVELNLNNLKLSDLELKEIPKVVLIIDEINRGNVSAIFGELITLIEEDKRMGELNELSVQLSYSKNKFSVPPNLYIIGTMNTADRSVEALDTALRRRFSFVEMLPNPDLIRTDGINRGVVELEITGGQSSRVDLSEILTKINQRIEVLVDRDHTIGHSYFLRIANSKDLKLAFQNKIIPLLQEYFYGNYSKMELVIGSKFFESSNPIKDVTFASTSQEMNVEQEKVYQLLDIAEFSDSEMFDALNSLINS